MNTNENGNTEIVITYQGRNLCDGLDDAQSAFVRVIKENLGEVVACSLSCVLAGEQKHLVCVNDLELSLIQDYARIHEFQLPAKLSR